jgi:hypothetical protein
MLLSELIAALDNLRAQHGDGPVTLWACERGEWQIEKVDHSSPKDGSDAYATVWGWGLSRMKADFHKPSRAAVRAFGIARAKQRLRSTRRAFCVLHLSRTECGRLLTTLNRSDSLRDPICPAALWQFERMLRKKLRKGLD